MNLNEYFRKIDTSIMVDCRKLVEEVFSFMCVLLIVPLSILLLLSRIMFPWLNPFITKEEV